MTDSAIPTNPRTRYGYRVIEHGVLAGTDFDGTANRGLIQVQKEWAPRGYERGPSCWVPFADFSFFTVNAANSVTLDLVDPEPDSSAIDPASGTNTARKRLLGPAAGALSDFIEDNLGNHWALMPRQRGNLYQVEFTTSGMTSAGTFRAEIWWELGTVRYA